MKQLWLKIISYLTYRCPKCGHATSGSSYGEYCKSESCDWIDTGE